MIGAAMWMLDFCDRNHPPGFELVGYAQLVLAFASFFCLLVFYPSLDSVRDFDDHHDDAAGPSKSTPQRVIVCGCLMLTLARALVTSGIEGGTSFLLETSYEFPQLDIGLII